MKLSHEQVSEFKELLEKEYGTPVSLKEAEKSAQGLLSVFTVLLKE